MSSEASKSWNHVRLLQAASEGLKTMGDLHAVQKQEKKAKKKKEKNEESASLEKAEQKEEDVGQEDSPASPELPGTAESEGVEQERLGDLRRHLQAQFSIREQAEDPTSDSQLMKLVGNLVHGEDEKALPVSTDESLEGRSTDCQLCMDDSTSHGRGLSMETLQRDFAELKEELVASIETMKTEVMEELQSLRETLYAYNDHHFFQDLSPLKELDENTFDQLKGSPYRIPEGGKLGSTISQEEKFKSRSVPTLHPLHVSGRNQAMFRAVNAITARNGFYSSLSRSNSDPVDPVEVQSVVLPPAVLKSATKKHLRKMVPASTPRTYSSNGKYGGKTGFKMAHHHPLPCEDHEGQPH